MIYELKPAEPHPTPPTDMARVREQVEQIQKFLRQKRELDARTN